jgi:hypothetical protein
VSGSLPLDTNGGACRRIPKSTQLRASPRNANKENSFTGDQIASWPLGHLGDAFVTMNLEMHNEDPNLDVEWSHGGHGTHGDACRAGARTIAGGNATMVRHEFRRRNELRLHNGLGMREMDERGRLVRPESAQQSALSLMAPAAPILLCPARPEKRGRDGALI